MVILANRVFFLGILLQAVLVGASHAHEARPLYIEVTETAPDQFDITWKTPVTVVPSNLPAVSISGPCTAMAPIVGWGTMRKQTFDCDALTSQAAVSISYPQASPSISTLIHFRRLSGESHSEVLSPGAITWSFPEQEGFWRTSRQYTILGIRHILEGIDHLLFVSCLLMIAGSFRRILVTITGFTIAHSVTLAAASLDLVSVPVPPVEAAIALSIVFVAREILLNKRTTLTWRYPVAVSSSFGLLHGFGFAAVVADVGLPQTETTTAILFFNLGVEIGQILFVLAILGGFFALRTVLVRLRKAARNREVVWSSLTAPASYLIGLIATFWMIERTAGFWA